MSDFLTLCQNAARECDLAGTGPTTVVDQVGKLGDIVRWMRNGYIELQTKKNGHLKFLRHGFTLATVDTQQSYASTACTDSTTALAIDRFGLWAIRNKHNPAKIYKTSAGVGAQTWMTWLPYDDFMALYGLGSQVDSHPHFITVDPQENILLGPTPDDIYTVTSEYYRSPEVMGNVNDTNTEVPELPTQFHQLLVYMTMDKYAGKQSAPEIKVRMKDEYQLLLRAFLAHQGQPLRRGRPLA